MLTFKGLIESDISHDEFISVHDPLKQYNDMKDAIKNHKSINLDNV